MVEEHAHELQVVGSRRVEAAAAHEKFRLLWHFKFDRFQRAVGATRMHRHKPLALRRAEPEACISHAERTEDVLVEIAFEPLAAHLFDHLARKIDIDAIFPAIAGFESQGRLERVVLAGDDSRQVGLFLVAAGILVPDVVGVSRGVRQ